MKINFEEFKKLRIRIGLIVGTERVEGTDKSSTESVLDKLLKLQVDFGDEKRQIVSGIAEFYTPEKLVGKQFPFVVNLEPRIIGGVESQGMILAVDVEGKAVLLKPHKKVPNGSGIK